VVCSTGCPDPEVEAGEESDGADDEDKEMVV
jgi:hypothetical protein